MSLNSEQMLPARVRKMRQMEDLLNVEDIILAEIERIIDEMYGAAAMTTLSAGTVVSLPHRSVRMTLFSWTAVRRLPVRIFMSVSLIVARYA